LHHRHDLKNLASTIINYFVKCIKLMGAAVRLFHS
jgi:hypothetical protein